MFGCQSLIANVAFEVIRILMVDQNVTIQLIPNTEQPFTKIAFELLVVTFLMIPQFGIRFANITAFVMITLHLIPAVNSSDVI